MNILQIIPHYLPASRFGGPQRVAHDLGKALKSLGHDVVVCTTNLEDEQHTLDVPVDKAHEIDGIPVYYEPVFLLRYWGFSPRMILRTWRLIRWADFVIVHFHYQFASVIGGYLSRLLKKPYIVFTHGSLNKQAIDDARKSLKVSYLRTVEYANFKRSLFLAFHSQEEMDRSMYSRFGVVVPSGISLIEDHELPEMGYFREKYPVLREKTIILFLSRLHFKPKGLNILIPAFARLHREKPNMHLVLAGPDLEKGRALCEKLAQQIGCSEAVTFTGMLTGRDKLSALQDSDIFVLPSMYEGLSVSLLEALYFGLPVVVTDQVGMCQFVRDNNAGVVVPVSEEGVYKGLLALSDADVRAEMSGVTIDLMKTKYTWEKIAGNLIADIEMRINNKSVFRGKRSNVPKSID